MGSVDQRQSGASAVEFAVIAPLFIAVLFAVVEFGIILYTQSIITHATREGARLGVVFSTPRTNDAAIRAEVQGFLDQCGLTSTAGITIAPPLASRIGGTPLTVRVDYTYQFFVLPRNITNFLFGERMANLNLAATTVMRME